ncbi:MAG: response regulator [Spirochaetales bacterium]|nr:response regulator [Spirochaetales bacterium]
MKTSDHRHHIHIRDLVAIGIVMAVCAILPSCSIIGKNISVPVVKGGVLDLRDWNFRKNGSVALNGQWEIYWNRLLVPEDFIGENKPAPTGYIDVPGFWKGKTIGGTRLDESGFATYRLRLLLPDNERRVGLKFQIVFSSYRLFVGDRFLLETGKVGRTGETSRPEMKPRIVFIEAVKEADVLLQISNFEMEQGGVWTSMTIGDQEHILQEREQRLGFEIFLFGAILIIGCYHLVFFASKLREKSFLFFGLFCIFIAFRIILHSERFFLSLFPDINWRLFINLQVLTFYLSVPCFIQFIFYLYPDETSKYFPRIFTVLHAVACFTLLLPYVISNAILTVMQLVTVAACLYIFIIIAKAFRNKRNGVIVFLIGFSVLFVTVVHDLLYTQEIIVSTHLIPIGQFVFIFCQAILLNLRFSSTFVEVEKMSRNLNMLLEQRKKYSEELEKEVESRTKDVIEVNRALVRSMDEANRANQAKSIFLANMSHELRTPLNAISGFAEIIEKSNDIEETKKFSKTIVKESEKLLELINQVLNMSKIEAGKLELEIVPFLLSELLSSIASFYGLQAEETGLSFSMTVDDDVPAALKGDPLRLRQILVNLIGNAVKFTEKGGISVNVTKNRKRGTRKVELKFSITDTGIGIPDDKQDIIFNNFEQVETSIARKYGGTGLGTAIANQLTGLMGGKMGVKSKPGEGSTFWFTASFGIPREDELKDVHKFEIKKLPSKIDATVLIVDDYQTNLKVAQIHLQNTGCHVLAAENGRKGIEVFGAHHCDLVLMDIQMPEMDGYAATRYIREELGNKDIPIIGLTAHAFDSDRQKCLEAGMNDVLTKPFQKKQLIEKVTYWLVSSAAFDASKICYKHEYVRPSIKDRVVAEEPDVLKPVDMERAYEEFEGDMEFFFNILFKFLENLKTQIILMKSAFGKKDKRTLVMEAHKLKGGAANITAYRISRVAFAIQKGAENERWDTVRSAIDELSSETDLLNDFYISEKVNSKEKGAEIKRSQ